VDKRVLYNKIKTTSENISRNRGTDFVVFISGTTSPQKFKD